MLSLQKMSKSNNPRIIMKIDVALYTRRIHREILTRQSKMTTLLIKEQLFFLISKGATWHVVRYVRGTGQNCLKTYITSRVSEIRQFYELRFCLRTLSKQIATSGFSLTGGESLYNSFYTLSFFLFLLLFPETFLLQP